MFNNPNILIPLEKLIRYLIIGIIIFGIWLIVFPFIKPMFHKTDKHKFKTLSKRKNIKLIDDINRLIIVSTNHDSKFYIYSFYFVSVTLFILLLIAMINADFSVINSLFISLLFGLIPYIFLKLRLREIRIAASWEAETTISEIINQYKMNYYNMYEALRKTEQILPRNSYTKKSLIRLVNQLSTYQTKDDLQSMIDDFVYSISTQWAVELGNNIYLSIEYGDNVTDSLDNLIEELKDLSNIAEDRKRLNNESFMMIRFFTPISYLISVIVVFKNFHFTALKFFDYQFRNQLGMKFFIITTLSIIFNFVIYDIFRKQKNDF